MAGRLIYVTGPSRTGIREALRRYVRYLRDSGQDEATLPQVVELAGHLERVAEDSVRNVLGYQQATLFRILQLPKPLLEDLWLQAFEFSLDEAKKARAQGRDALLTFHAIWYHHQNREYISAASLPRLSQGDARADMVVTLIDDIYDVRARLSEGHGLFAHPLDESLLEVEDIVLKLLLVLDWRMAEQLVSEKIASVACPPRSHFLFAVKHPLATLRALLQSAGDESRRAVYLSHPISEPRAMRRMGSKEEAEKAIRGIQSMAAKLRDNVILFEPTTIDEALLEFEVPLADGRVGVVPLLGERWPLPAEEQYLLFAPPANRRAAEFGTEWASKSKEILEAHGKGQQIPYLNELSSVSGLLAMLRDAILRHINLRDHKLIDQSNWLVAYRPYLDGKLAGGVEEEIKYGDRLMRSGKREHPALVLHPPEDERARPREALRSFLVNCLQEGRLANADESKIESAVESLAPDSLAKDGTNLELGRSIQAAAQRGSFGFRKRKVKGALTKDKASIEEEEDERRGNDFREFLRCFLEDLAQGSIELIGEDLEPVTFAERVIARISEASAPVTGG